MSVETLVYKTAPTEIKALSDTKDEGVYEGHFAIFGTEDEGGDVIEAGAFTKTLAQRGPASGRNRIKLAYYHRAGLTADLPLLVGPPPDVLEEDSTGLYAKGRITRGAFWGNEVWALLKDGALTEGSIGYAPIPARIRWEKLTRYLAEVKLYELSFVPFGMNPDTQISAVKALTKMLGEPGVCDDWEAVEILYRLLDYIRQGRFLRTVELPVLERAAEMLGDTQGTLRDLLTLAAPDDVKALIPYLPPDPGLLAALGTGAPLDAPHHQKVLGALDHLRAVETQLQAVVDAATPEATPVAHPLAPSRRPGRAQALAVRIAAGRAGIA